MSAVKYIKGKDINAIHNHYAYCEQNKYPFIKINRLNKEYSEIFFDVTNLFNSVQIQEVANKTLREIYLSYCRFFTVDYYVYEKFTERYYFFQFAVHEKHAEFIADKLFDFLLFNLKE